MVLASAMTLQSENAELRTANPKATDAFSIEEIFSRAHQIHREHGGFFGYDLEDWVLAWRDLPQTAESKSSRQNEQDSEFVSGQSSGMLEACFGCSE